MPTMKYLPFLFLAFLLGCETHDESTLSEHTDDAPIVEHLLTSTALEGGPFSSAVRVDNMLYLSGQIGVLPGTRNLAPGGIQGQAHQTLKNIKITLEELGSSMKQVVKCTVMIDNIEEWGAFNEVYATYDIPGSDFPGQNAVQANAGDGCLAAFDAYVGIDYFDSTLEISALTPTSDSWGQGDREVVCFLFDLNGAKLTTSARGTGI